jgi:hypothetical protein
MSVDVPLTFKDIQQTAEDSVCAMAALQAARAVRTGFRIRFATDQARLLWARICPRTSRGEWNLNLSG